MKNENKNTQKEDSLVLLQFYADWCQPCRMMMPIVESIKQKQIEWLTIKQIDVDKDPATSNQFHIRSIPTFVILKNNKEVWRNVGMLPEHSFSEILESLK